MPIERPTRPKALATPGFNVNHEVKTSLTQKKIVNALESVNQNTSNKNKTIVEKYFKTSAALQSVLSDKVIVHSLMEAIEEFKKNQTNLEQLAPADIFSALDLGKIDFSAKSVIQLYFSPFKF